MKTGKAGRRILFILSLLLFVCSSGNAQTKLTTAQWQSDLSYLQKKIHSDYSNLFYNVTAKQFDSAVVVLQKQIPHLTENEIRVGFIRLIAVFRIGHTLLRMRTGENEDSLKPMFHFFPLTISHFNDGLYIQQIDTAYKESLGGRIVKIGNTPIDEVLKRMHTVIPCENEQYFKSHLHYYLRIPEILQALHIIENPEAATIKYIKDGTERNLTIKMQDYPAYAWNDGLFLPKGWVDAYENFNKPASVLWMKEPAKLRYFEYLKESKTVYVRHIAVVDRPGQMINGFFEKVFRFIDTNEVDKLVLDIRLNGGGNNYLNKPVITGIIQSKKINRYGHLFVITGAATFSAAQNLTNELEKYTEAIFAGEPTAENVNFWGDIRTEVLPISKLNVNLSWLWWQNMDPRDKRQWTAPNLAAEMSFENYKAGHDSAMNIILNFKEEKRIEEKIKDLVTTGNVEEALSITKEYMENPLHRYCKNELEEKINDMAYGMIIQDKAEAAKSLFSMNVQLFPNSANVYDSYAECLYRMGRNEEAKKNYEIAIAKDPKGPTGDNSRKMLAMIKQKQ
jgi:tetratricopeptide (TPR) repeat protein